VVQHHNLCHGDGMTRITLQDGRVVLRDGKVGTQQGCCCGGGGCPCKTVIWTHVYGGCTNIATQTVTAEAEEDCYAYYRVEDFDCVNPLTGRDCGEGDTCDFFARVKINGNQLGPIEYQQPDDTWATGGPGGTCQCMDAFDSLTAQVNCGCEECVNNSFLPADCEMCNDLYPLSTNVYNAAIAADDPPCGYDSGLTGLALFAAMDDACSGYDPPVYCYVCEEGGYWVQISGCGCTGSCKRCYGTPCSNACSQQNLDCICDSVLPEDPECGDTVAGVCCGSPSLCA
jgi:hypothetical protein